MARDRRCWFLALVLALPGLPALAADCSAQRGFERGHAGVAATAECEATDYREAWRLGSELAALEAEQRGVDARIAEADDGGARNRLARRSRQLGVDIEAIRGALTVRGIVMHGPTRPESAESAPVESKPADSAPAESERARADPEQAEPARAEDR